MTIQHPFLKQLELPSLDGTLVKTRVLATHYGKSNDYILIQPFTVSPVAWEGVSLIHYKVQITAPTNLSIVRLPTKPTNANFCLCIFWRISEGVGARYKLWSGVGERLYAPLYAGEVIPASFILEFWNTEDETDVVLDTTLEIKVSSLTASSLLCGDGGTEVSAIQTTGGDYVFDSDGLSVDYSLDDHWLLTGLDDVEFVNVADPAPGGTPTEPEDITDFMWYWFDATNMPITSPSISDADPIGISYPVYTGWVNKPPAVSYTSYQAASSFRPTYRENILGSQPGILFDSGDSMPLATSLEPGGGSFTLICVCKQVSQAGVLLGGVKLAIATNSSNEITFGHNASVGGWSFLTSDTMSTAATAVKMIAVRLNFTAGTVSYRENKTDKGSDSFTLAAGFESFNNMCADAEGTDMFGGYIFEWLLWAGTLSDTELDDLYDTYFKPKWTGLP